MLWFRFLDIVWDSRGFLTIFGGFWGIIFKVQFRNTDEFQSPPHQKFQDPSPSYFEAEAHRADFSVSRLSGLPGLVSLRLRENRSLVSAAGASGTNLPPLAIMIIEIILKHAVLTNMCSLFWSVLFDHLTHLPSLQNEIYNQLGSSWCIDTNIITSEGQMFREVALYLYCICIDQSPFHQLTRYITEVFL